MAGNLEFQRLRCRPCGGLGPNGTELCCWNERWRGLRAGHARDFWQHICSKKYRSRLQEVSPKMVQVESVMKNCQEACGLCASESDLFSNEPHSWEFSPKQERVTRL